MLSTMSVTSPAPAYARTRTECAIAASRYTPSYGSYVKITATLKTTAGMPPSGHKRLSGESTTEAATATAHVRRGTPVGCPFFLPTDTRSYGAYLRQYWLLTISNTSVSSISCAIEAGGTMAYE